MRRRLIIVSALVVAVLLALFWLVPLTRDTSAVTDAGGTVRIEQIDTAAYPEVRLFVSVLDDSGRPRGDLSSSDFSLTEDGTPVDVHDFGGAGAANMSAALVIDRSGSMDEGEKIEGAREAANAFIDMLRPTDQAALIAFNSDSRLIHAFSGDSDTLRRSVAAINPNGGTALYDAIVAGVDHLRDQQGRRVLLVLTDGQDCREPNSCPAGEGSDYSLSEAIAYADQAGQPVYVVGLGDRRLGADDGGIDEQVLERIAAETGGRYFYAPDAAELAILYSDLAGNVQQEYLLSYTSPRPFYDGTRRDIQVRVAGVTVGGGYTERHLINVVSSPLVGLILLVPLAGLLVVPEVVSRRRKTHPNNAVQLPEAVAAAQLPEAAVPLTPYQDVPVAAPLERRYCVACGAAIRPMAQFCSHCGVAQPPQAAAATERRRFCDMCGRPLAPGAKFCSVCGTAVGGPIAAAQKE